MATYRAFGLNFDSAIALPELHPATGIADVVIDFCRGDPGHGVFDRQIDVGDSAMLLELDDIRFRIAADRIAIVAPPATEMKRVRIWLLGSVMAALLAQRDRLTLHANAVALRSGNAAAFVGESGAGKSTLAVLLAKRGADVLCDDLCAVRFDGERIAVDRGIPRAKLWQETLDHLGYPSEGLDPVVTGHDKYQMPLAVSQAGGDGPFTLARIYLLERGAEDAKPRIERVAGAAAGRLVIDNAYRWHVATQWHGEQWAFDRCLDIARGCDIFRFVRPWSLDRVDTGLDLIEAHLRLA